VSRGLSAIAEFLVLLLSSQDVSISLDVHILLATAISSVCVFLSVSEPQLH